MKFFFRCKILQKEILKIAIKYKKMRPVKIPNKWILPVILRTDSMVLAFVSYFLKTTSLPFSLSWLLSSETKTWSPQNSTSVGSKSPRYWWNTILGLSTWDMSITLILAAPVHVKLQYVILSKSRTIFYKNGFVYI